MSELAAAVPSSVPLTDVDLGWALGTLFRSYLLQVGEATAEVPGGLRAYRVMAIAAAGSCQNQAAMAETLELDRTMMTYLVDGLENDGLVIRTPDPGDRRARRVTLTAQGESLLAELKSRVEVVERRLLAGLPADSAERFRHDLARVARSAPDGSSPGAAEPGAAEPGAAEPCTAEACTS